MHDDGADVATNSQMSTSSPAVEGREGTSVGGGMVVEVEAGMALADVAFACSSFAELESGEVFSTELRDFFSLFG